MTARALSFAGDAIITTITADIAPGDLTIQIAANAGWPSGSGGKPFVAMLISADLLTHEKILVSSRTGTTLSVALRAWDSTLAAGFTAGATIMHVADAFTLQVMSDHVDDPNPAGHSSLLNAARHDLTVRHQFGGALVRPTVMQPIGTAGAIGNTQTQADGAHTHALDPSIAGPGLQLLAGILGLVYDDATVTVSGDTLQVKANGIGTAQLASHAVQAGQIDPATVWPGTFPGTGVVTLAAQIADGIITRAKLATDARKSVDVAWGWIDSALSNTDQTGISSGATITNMQATLTAVANRRYRTTVMVPRFQQISSAGEVQIEITDGSNVRITGTAVNEPLACMALAANGVGFATIVLYETGLSAGAHTRRARISTSGGTVNVPGSTHQGIILCEDIGPS